MFRLSYYFFFFPAFFFFLAAFLAVALFAHAFLPFFFAVAINFTPFYLGYAFYVSALLLCSINLLCKIYIYSGKASKNCLRTLDE